MSFRPLFVTITLSTIVGLALLGGMVTISSYAESPAIGGGVLNPPVGAGGVLNPSVDDSGDITASSSGGITASGGNQTGGGGGTPPGPVLFKQDPSQHTVDKASENWTGKNPALEQCTDSNNWPLQKDQCHKIIKGEYNSKITIQAKPESLCQYKGKAVPCDQYFTKNADGSSSFTVNDIGKSGEATNMYHNVPARPDPSKTEEVPGGIVISGSSSGGSLGSGGAISSGGGLIP